MQHISLLSIKESVFFAEVKKGIKRPEHPFKHSGQKYQWVLSAVVSQIPNEYPDQPKAACADRQDEIEKQSAGAAFIPSAHCRSPYFFCCVSGRVFPPRFSAFL